MIRFIILLFLPAIILVDNGHATIYDYPADKNFLDGYYTSFIDQSANEPPFFVNKQTGEILYIGKDISLKNLIGYRFERRRFFYPSDQRLVQSEVITKMTTLDDLLYPRSNWENDKTQLCAFAPDNSLIGKRCTDAFFGHTESPETKTPGNYYYNFDHDFYLTWVREKAGSLQLPFFHNPKTNTNWYLGRDLPLSALTGYRLRIRPVNGQGDISQSGLDITIDDNTIIDDLMFRLTDYNDFHHAVRGCLYNPRGKPIGRNDSCTDAYYDHNYFPYQSEPDDYSYHGRIDTIKAHSTLRGEFMENYDDHKESIPDNGEVTFTLRFYRNDNIPISLNLSDAFTIDFFRKKATIIDTNSGERHNHKFQQTNSNITLSLTVSHGLPANYKTLKIVEDKGCTYYENNYFQLNGLPTPDDEEERILNNPFYQIKNKSNDSFEFIKLNSNVYIEETVVLLFENDIRGEKCRKCRLKNSRY